MTEHNVIQGIKQQRTFCLVKPDGVQRGLIGEIIARVEKVGLKVVALKMFTPSAEQIRKHYPMEDQAWVERIGNKGLGTFIDLKLDAKEHLGTDNALEVGRTVVESLVGYMTSGPVVAMVVEGVQAIEMVRKLAGNTIPAKANLGTIRGDYSVDSPAVANVELRALHNLLHASETEDEAKAEISLWFTPQEIHDYNRTSEAVMFSKTY